MERCYNESVYVRPGLEVIGQDGFGWYTWADDAADICSMFRGLSARPSRNPLFTYIEGMNAAKLRRAGFTRLRA